VFLIFLLRPLIYLQVKLLIIDIILLILYHLFELANVVASNRQLGFLPDL